MRRFFAIAAPLAALSTAAIVTVALSVGAAGASGSAPADTSYAIPGGVEAKVDGIEDGPWNTSQGDPTLGTPYYEQGSSFLFPYTPSEASAFDTTTEDPKSHVSILEPNLAVYPTGSTTNETPYPAGVAGTPGPDDDYCSSGGKNPETGSPNKEPEAVDLPFAPYYFPDVVRNADGSLTGYFDYRPKDTEEAITVARSTNDGVTWKAQGTKLGQNQGYCPTADANDDGQGHPFVMSTGSATDLYTLQRAAGDIAGVGLLVHEVSPAASDPLGALPANQSIGIDPNTFVTAATKVEASGGVEVPVSNTGTAGSAEQIVNGSYEVIPAGNSEPSSSTIINCTGPTSAPSTEGTGDLTGCTSASGGSVELHEGDDLIQVIATGNPTSSSGSRDCATIGNHVPVGPNNSAGSGGISAICYTQPSTPVAPITDYLWSLDAPNRVYMNGETVYCNGESSGRVKLENCTTTGSAFEYTTASKITGDPIIPANTSITTGLVAPDGIIGSLGTGFTHYNGHEVSAGANVILYTEKLLNYYIEGTETGELKSGTYSAPKEVKLPLASTEKINYQPLPTTSEPLPASGSFTVYVGTEVNKENGPIVALSCKGWEAATQTGVPTGSVNLNECSGGTSGETILEEADIGGPNAAIVPGAVLHQTGEGKVGKTSGPTDLDGNNEDLSLVRAAYTTNGVNFTDLGALSSESTKSGEQTGAYADLSNSSQQESPEESANPVATNTPKSPTNLKPGEPDTVELRYIGSRGTIVRNPDGTWGMFMSGAWPSDGDSDAFNQVFYSYSSNGETWSVPKVVISTDYTFSASAEQEKQLEKGEYKPLGISAYYSGRAYGPSVVQNSDGALSMTFSGYRVPKGMPTAGEELGTKAGALWKIGEHDPALYRNILTVKLGAETTTPVESTSALTSSAPETNLGGQVSYTDTITDTNTPSTTIQPTGTVEFKDEGTPISGCQTVAPRDNLTDATATCTTTTNSAGTQTIEAVYSGDSNYDTSTAGLSQVIYASAPQGNWVGTYGEKGYDLAAWEGNSDLVSPGLTATLVHGSRYVWTVVPPGSWRVAYAARAS